MFRSAPYVLVALLVVPLLGAANPMRPDPQSAQQAAVPDKVSAQTQRVPRLIGIVIIGAWQRALFSGNRELAVGDRIAGFTLIAVNATSVLLKRGGQTTQLTLQSTGEMVISPALED
ncbi:MAG: hypothetical protein ACI9RY_001499 [Reinekea sp.]|jgi:hypothetical protein